MYTCAEKHRALSLQGDAETSPFDSVVKTTEVAKKCLTEHRLYSLSLLALPFGMEKAVITASPNIHISTCPCTLR